jgi:DnaJ-class molecular chaperone
VIKLLEIALVLGLIWVVRARFWPYTQCRRCEGRKVNAGSNGKRYGLCSKCHGSGSRIVLGARTVRRLLRAPSPDKKG